VDKSDRPTTWAVSEKGRGAFFADLHPEADAISKEATIHLKNVAVFLGFAKELRSKNGGSHKCPTKATRLTGEYAQNVAVSSSKKSSQKSAYSADARLCQIAQLRFVAVLYALSGVRSSSRKSFVRRALLR
jgi:hypothetical protein